MAFDNNQEEPKLPTNKLGKRNSSDLLPRYFRTNNNKKFLQATLDQLIQPGTVKKLNGFVGRKSAKAVKTSDVYVDAAEKVRQDYQFEPAAIVQDNFGNVTFFKDYIDHINHINTNGGITNDHARINKQEYYAWNSHIDWDKFVNYQQYYWMPFGPEPVSVFGQQLEITSTYTVKGVNEEDNVAYLFTPNGLTRNPKIKLFRGQTYKFEIDAPGHPFSIKKLRTSGSLDRYTKGVDSVAVEKGTLTFTVPQDAPNVLFYVSENSVDTGGVFHVLDVEENTAVDVDNEIIGKKTYQIPNGPGKSVALSNGMKLEFKGQVTPEKYATGYWYVEGVGSAIKLIAETDLEIRSSYSADKTLLFDDVPFDRLPFSETGTFPVDQDYITINRGSPDLNPWSRYNRWFHKDVIELSATVMKRTVDLDQTGRAKRPIIEFNSGIKLFNYGHRAKKSVDVIDTFTKDVFSTIEGSLGYNVDGIDLVNGMRILFTGDTDITVKNKIYDVNFITVTPPVKTLSFNSENAVNVDTDTITFTERHGLTTRTRIVYTSEGNTVIGGLLNRQVYYIKVIDTFTIELYARADLSQKVNITSTSTGVHQFETYTQPRNQIYLSPSDDHEPIEYETVSVNRGIKNQGLTYWYNGTNWLPAQEKTKVNQPPLFDIFDADGYSYSDLDFYQGSNFLGNKIFSYAVGTGSNDSVLGFPLSYRNINNIGDIVFDFNLLSDPDFFYKAGDTQIGKNSDIGFLKIIEDLDRITFENGWTSKKYDFTTVEQANEVSIQPVVREYKNETTNKKVNGEIVTLPLTNNFLLDVYDNLPSDIELIVNVYLNGVRLHPSKYSVVQDINYKKVVLAQDITDIETVVTIETTANWPKNEKGFYKLPINLENNPLNNNIGQFTLGEVINHVDMITRLLPNFTGEYPGNSNLRDLGGVSKYGRRFIQHVGPVNLSLYHLGDKSSNLFKGIEKASNDYGTFKRSFVNKLSDLGIDADPLVMVNEALRQMFESRPKSTPYYLSDMLGYSAFNRIEHIVLDGNNKTYGMTRSFNLNSLSNKSVLIYHNGIQLLHGRDYVFNEENFFTVLSLLQEDDLLEVYEYDTTDGCFIPPTPTKLGIYPLYEPEIFIDNTYIADPISFRVPNVVPETTKIIRIDRYNNIIDDYLIKIFVDGIQKEYDTDYTITKDPDSAIIEFATILDKNSLVEIYVPDTKLRGHDGSSMFTFNDYRDQCILEFERRIFNNVKVKYDPSIFDIYDHIPGYSRPADYSLDEYNKIISKFFYQWTTNINQDYTKGYPLDLDNSFSFNYRDQFSPDNKPIPAFWRGIYYWMLDTDQPHIRPWECLGFSIKPLWWEDTYGPAPYTRDNLVMWDDIKTGTIREPGQPIYINPKFSKGILSQGAPVDEYGNLLSPLQSGYALGTLPLTEGYYQFGDCSPVEYAWRQSSYYPFAVLQTILLMRPNDTLGRCLDRSRIIKNKVGQLVYKDTYKRLRLEDIKVPSVAEDEVENRIYTAGLINYVVDYITSKNTDRIQQYKNDLKNLTNKMSNRLGGYTNKEKYKILLDSKTPTSTGGVFVPEENYIVALNTSSAIKKVVYSGIIVTKYPDGFEIRGYDFDNPFLTVYPGRTIDRVFKVGGISESFVEWESAKLYVIGKIVRYNNLYYRTKMTHTSGADIDEDKFVRLAELPILGGREIIIKSNFKKSDAYTIAYGVKLPTVQDVVDVILGYGAYLEDQGFVFDDFNNALGVVTNWETSAKEFAFWSTQGWNEGSAISLSPASDKIIYKGSMVVVESLLDPFYGYNVYRVDGQKLDPEFIQVYRSENDFVIQPENTPYGIYGLTLYLVQKEHVVVLDNQTLFNDTIYDLEAGFHQERVKVVGYTSSNWNGGFEVKGFVYDQAKIQLWEPWIDYNLGDIVKHKEFYYAAKSKLIGAETFDSNNWVLLEDKPTSQLLPNWDYKVEQFTDFYDLDTDNLDAGQQRIAQHLIGYQKRQYLENIIQNDVSQYKFYQGMIIEKGTQNVLNKLFDVLSAADQESLTFDEEWAIRVGEYGAIDTYDEIELILDEDEFKIEPQPLELVNSININSNDFVYRQLPSDIYVKPKNNTLNVWPTTGTEQYLRSAGYVRADDVKFVLDELSSVTNYNISEFKLGDYVWCGFEGRSWNVFRFSKSTYKIVNAEYANPTKTVTLTLNKNTSISIGDIIGITGSEKLSGFAKVTSVTGNQIKFIKEIQAWQSFTDALTISLFEFTSQRSPDIDSANDYIPSLLKNNELLWTDKNENNKFAVYVNSPAYRSSRIKTLEETRDHGVLATVSRSSNVATITTAFNHGLTPYDKVVISNCSNASFNTASVTVTITGPKTFTFNNSGPDVTSVAASGIVQADINFGKAVSITGNGNVAAIADDLRVHIYKKTTDSTSWALTDRIDDIATGLKFSNDGRWLALAYPEHNNNTGKIQMYLSLSSGEYDDEDIIVSNVPTVGEKFGSALALAKADNAYILAVGVQNKVYIFQAIENVWSLESVISNSAFGFGTNVALSGDGKFLIVSAPDVNTTSGEVYVYRYNGVSYNYLQTLSRNEPNDAERFGGSIAISSSGNYLAVGSPLMDLPKIQDAGQVFIYKFNGTNFGVNPIQTINSPKQEQIEKFGYKLEFMNDDSSLVVFALNGDIYQKATFDTYSQTIPNYPILDYLGNPSTSKYVNDPQSSIKDQSTSFDSDSLSIVDIILDRGRLDVFDRFNENYIYGESLENVSTFKSSYGNQLAVGNNCVLVSAENEEDGVVINAGIVYSYVKPVDRRSWNVLYEQIDKPNVKEIKKAYLYNKKTNSIVSYLDVVDPTQGKIPGIADQEIKFKTYFDPAVYSKGTSTVIVDDGSNWTKAQVGMLWWDLTTARFVESQSGDVSYRSRNWNSLFPFASIDVYEWVESTLLPSQWNKLADTEKGIAQGVSGQTRYGDDVYSVNKQYDNISKTFKETYYYWVKNKTILPRAEGRFISAFDVAQLIANPELYGYSCLAFTGTNSLSLINCKKYLESSDVVLSIQHWASSKKDTNYHSQWKLLSSNRNTVIPEAIETKWFQSLIGKDSNGSQVPDLRLPLKQRYGIEFRPLQSMFVNRIEALKQFIERVNSVLKNKLIVDDYDISDLNSYDPLPTNVSGLWDVQIDTDQELRFVSTTGISKPSLLPVIEKGKIKRIDILNAGQGFGRNRIYQLDINNDPVLWYGPDIAVTGAGRGAEIKTLIDQAGKIVDTIIVNAGEGYKQSSTILTIRNYSVLVSSDTSNNNVWSIYTLDYETKLWSRIQSQSYDVRKFWKYIDWYGSYLDTDTNIETQYNQFTKIDFLVENTNELLTTDIPINSIIKVKNVGSGGWMLVKKINNAPLYTEDNYAVIGRENGTIKFLDNLYVFSANALGYDGPLFDSNSFDGSPDAELRIILNTIKNNIFTDELYIDYLNLFFASVRYALHEQIFVDWAFKTSFVKSQHNVGELKQKVTYNNDNLQFFEDYINEVKPYRTKIREFVSNYSTLEPSRSFITDFDLIPIVTENFQIQNKNFEIDLSGNIFTNFGSIEDASFADSYIAQRLGFKLLAIKVVDQGSGYITAPVVTLENARLTNQYEESDEIKLKAYIANGKVNRIEIVSAGGPNWFKAPRVIFEGGLSPTGVPAKAVAIIGDPLLKSTLVKVKFDRVSGAYEVTQLTENEIFSGDIVSGSRTQFPLRWSPEIKYGSSYVTVNGIPMLRSEYQLSTITSTTKGFTSYSGLLTFREAPVKGSSITIEYNKNFDHLHAVDRINFFYDPSSGQIGKDPAQLMTGIDFGGVNITGVDFGVTYGWNSKGWGVEGWDNFNESFIDFVTYYDGTNYSFKLPYVPQVNQQVNFYVSRFIPRVSSYSALPGSPNVGDVRKTLDTGHVWEYNGIRWVDQGIYISDYWKAVRIDDPDYQTINQTNDSALMTTYVGDGEVDILTLPLAANLQIYTYSGNQYGDRVIFRKPDSDGSYPLEQDSYDTQLSGGSFNGTTLLSATGLEPDDIILDGEEFISPANSGPEEFVPGYVLDTFAIKVYHRPSGGCPNIVFKNHIADGTNTDFLIGQYFPNENSVIVKVDDQIKDLVADYTIDYQNNTIKFVLPPSQGSRVDILSMSFNSSNVLDIDNFVGNGETLEFITKAAWLPTVTAIVLLNGEVPEYSLFSTDEEYTEELDQTWRSRVGIKFAEPPPAGSLVTYIIDAGNVEQNASIVKSEEITYQTGISSYELLNKIGQSTPYDQNVLVKVGQTILRPPSANYFTMINDQKIFTLRDYKYDLYSIDVSEIKIFVNNEQLSYGADYHVNLNFSEITYSIDGESVTLDNFGLGYTVGDILDVVGGDIGVYGSPAKFEVTQINPVTGAVQLLDIISAGLYITPPSGTLSFTGGTGSACTINALFVTNEDPANITVTIDDSRYIDNATVAIIVNSDADYLITNENAIKLLNTYPNGTKIEIISFYNHNVLGIERTVDDLIFNTAITAGTVEYHELSNKLGGTFTLRNTVVNSNFVWVIKNGELLVANVDYYLEADFITLKLKDYLYENDVVQIIAFTNTVVHDSFGYMQFKDMLNRTHYKRLSAAKATVLVTDLYQNDKDIHVKDASVLDTPDPSRNTPGIIEINGERIEYFVKVGNTLSQLRRGTLGTGLPKYHAIDSVVQGIGRSETIPYRDTQSVKSRLIVTGDDGKVQLDFIPKIDEIEVFLGGRRLKKSEYSLYFNDVYPYSPEGDEVQQVEFELDPANSYGIQLNVTDLNNKGWFNVGAKILVVRKRGKLWNDLGKRLAKSDNLIANFLKNTPTVWPNKQLDKY